MPLPCPPLRATLCVSPPTVNHAALVCRPDTPGPARVPHDDPPAPVRRTAATGRRLHAKMQVTKPDDDRTTLRRRPASRWTPRWGEMGRCAAAPKAGANDLAKGGIPNGPSASNPPKGLTRPVGQIRPRRSQGPTHPGPAGDEVAPPVPPRSPRGQSTPTRVFTAAVIARRPACASAKNMPVFGSV